MRMMYHLAYMALRMSLYPVLTIAYQVGRFAFLVQIGFDMTFLFVFEISLMAIRMPVSSTSPTHG